MTETTEPRTLGATARPPRVRSAEHQRAGFLDDLTTTGTAATGHTVPADWDRLHSTDTPPAAGPVPGWQVDGYFPSAGVVNSHHGWYHDAQFVLRLPADWNGKLVVTAAPGIRQQYSADRLISDRVLAKGYAYAATDKGNSGTDFHLAGRGPGDAIEEWTRRLTELAVAAHDTVRLHYGVGPDHSYVTGMSNGGYLTRIQLERFPDLYDGGVDWEGALWLPDDPALFDFLPQVLAHYPRYRDTGDEDARRRLIAAGLPAGSEFLWDIHHRVYWELVRRTYRAVFFPGTPEPGQSVTGTASVGPGEPGGTSEHGYAAHGDTAHPAAVREALIRVSCTGAIGKPLLSVHGTLDAFLPIGLHSDRYTRLVADADRGHLHRQYRVEGGNHVDGFCDLFPGRLRPLLPLYRTVFEALESWVEDGVEPPDSRDVLWDASVNPEDISTW